MKFQTYNKKKKNEKLNEKIFLVVQIKQVRISISPTIPSHSHNLFVRRERKTILEI